MAVQKPARGRSGARRSTGVRAGASGSRRGPPPRRKGTPPIVLGLAILLPLVGVLVATIIWKNRSPGNEQEATEQYDPNAEIDKLETRFRALQDATLATLRMDRESVKFRSEVMRLKKAWSEWMEDYDEVFAAADAKNPDGTWKPQYQPYSGMKGRAGTLRLDLIKSGNF